MTGAAGYAQYIATLYSLESDTAKELARELPKGLYSVGDIEETFNGKVLKHSEILEKVGLEYLAIDEIIIEAMDLTESYCTKVRDIYE